MLRIGLITASLICMLLFINKPSCPQSLQTAIRLTESEQFDEARKEFDALIAKEPNNGDNYYYSGECWIKWYLADSASLSLKETMSFAMMNFYIGSQKDSANPLNYIGMGRTNIFMSDYDTANILFEKAKAKLPWKNYSKSAISLQKQAITFAKIAEAKLKIPGKTQAELLELIDKAVERCATVPEVYLIKGDIYLEYNDGSNAILAYNKANDLDPKSCKAMVKIGQLWVRGKAYNDALGYYKDAIKIDSAFAPAYRERAELYGLAGQWENAIKDYQKFLELSGKNTYAKVRYASFLFMAKKYDEALTIINEVFAIDKSYNILNRLAAYSYFETGKFAEGLKSIETFLKYVKPEKIIASDYSYYGKLLAKTGNDSLAIIKLQKAFEMDSTNYDILSEKAKSQSKIKDYEGVVVTFQKKINANKASLNDYYELGKAYFNLKQWVQADTALGTVLAKKSDFLNALKYRAMANVNLDSTSENGLAKKYYEALIVIYLKDSAKYAKDLFATSGPYDYMRFYFFKQYLKNKKCEDAKSSIIYCEKILAYDPKDERSLSIKKALAGKCP